MIDISDNSMYNLRILLKADNCLSLRKGGSIMTYMTIINLIKPMHSAISEHSDNHCSYFHTSRRSAE